LSDIITTDAPPLATPPRKESALTRWALLLIPAAAAFGLDQGAKAWVLANLALGQSMTPIPALEGLFAFTLSANTGAAFSLLPQLGDVFLLIALAMVIGIPLFYSRFPAGHWIERVALGLLLGGVCGNALDRLRFGYVVDFFHITIPSLLSNVSNFADHAIVLGILTLFVMQWRREDKPAA
jgi:signal peptidase II